VAQLLKGWVGQNIYRPQQKKASPGRNGFGFHKEEKLGKPKFNQPASGKKILEKKPDPCKKDSEIGLKKKGGEPEKENFGHAEEVCWEKRLTMATQRRGGQQCWRKGQQKKRRGQKKRNRPGDTRGQKPGYGKT